MDIINHSLNRRIRQALYALKRAFGSTVVLHKLLDTETNYTTGAKSVENEAIVIPRCVVLPVKIQREVVQTISVISANKSFAYGGTYDTDTRIFIIDSRDLPRNHIIQIDDWVEFNGYRYNPKTIEELEQRSGWAIIGKRVIGPSVKDMHLISEPEINQESEND